MNKSAAHLGMLLAGTSAGDQNIAEIDQGTQRGGGDDPRLYEGAGQPL